MPGPWQQLWCLPSVASELALIQKKAQGLQPSPKQTLTPAAIPEKRDLLGQVI